MTKVLGNWNWASGGKFGAAGFHRPDPKAVLVTQPAKLQPHPLEDFHSKEFLTAPKRDLWSQPCAADQIALRRCSISAPRVCWLTSWCWGITHFLFLSLHHCF